MNESAPALFVPTTAGAFGVGGGRRRRCVREREIMDFYDETTFPALEKVIQHHQEGLNLYLKGDWSAAKEILQEALNLNPDDKASWTLLQRCMHFEKKPPDGDWDGVWEMESK